MVKHSKERTHCSHQWHPQQMVLAIAVTVAAVVAVAKIFLHPPPLPALLSKSSINHLLSLPVPIFSSINTMNLRKHNNVMESPTSMMISPYNHLNPCHFPSQHRLRQSLNDVPLRCLVLKCVRDLFTVHPTSHQHHLHLYSYLNLPSTTLPLPHLIVSHPTSNSLSIGFCNPTMRSSLASLNSLFLPRVQRDPLNLLPLQTVHHHI